MRTTIQTSDERLKDAVTAHLEWDPAVDSTDIAVDVADGRVTLRGSVATYPAKLAAGTAARRVRGVRAVANSIAVRPTIDRTDEDLAEDAMTALHLHGTVPRQVRAEAAGGRITLIGHVDWPFQRRSAERAVREIRGVRDVVDKIAVVPSAAVHDVRHRIIRSLQHNADLDSRHIVVSVTRDRAILTGTVGSWLEREAAERAAANAPGIVSVDNRIEVATPAWATSDADELC